jgi:hypothetical protein
LLVLARRLDYIFFERAEREAMTVDRLYTLEKLSAGVGALATNPGRLKDRIAAAFSHGLYGVNPKALSPEAQAVWSKLYAKLTTAQDTERGAIAASLDFLDEDDAQQIAQGIWTVYVMLESDLRHSG